MPMSPEFKQRLFPRVKKIAEHYGTPFHIYDEAGIRQTGWWGASPTALAIP